MSGHDDYVDDMHVTDFLDDEAIEAFFRGQCHPAWERDAALVKLASEVDVASSGVPPVVNPALAELLGETTAPSPVLRVVAGARLGTGRNVPSNGHFPKRRSSAPRRLPLWPTVAAATAMAAAALAVAGTTGVVPEPAVRLAARVVEALTPYELSDNDDPGPSPVDPGVTVPAGPATPAPTGSAPKAPPAAPAGPVNRSAPAPAAPAPEVAPPGPPASTGVDRARQTPAGAFIPPFVPSQPQPEAQPDADEGPPASPASDRVEQTPAAGVAPPFARSGDRPGPR